LPERRTNETKDPLEKGMARMEVEPEWITMSTPEHRERTSTRQSKGNLRSLRGGGFKGREEGWEGVRRPPKRAPGGRRGVLGTAESIHVALREGGEGLCEKGDPRTGQKSVIKNDKGWQGIGAPCMRGRRQTGKTRSKRAETSVWDWHARLVA